MLGGNGHFRGEIGWVAQQQGTKPPPPRGVPATRRHAFFTCLCHRIGPQVFCAGAIDSVILIHHPNRSSKGPPLCTLVLHLMLSISAQLSFVRFYFSVRVVIVLTLLCTPVRSDAPSSWLVVAKPAKWAEAKGEGRRSRDASLPSIAQAAAFVVFGLQATHRGCALCVGRVC